MCLDGEPLIPAGTNLKRCYMLMKGTLLVSDPSPAGASSPGGGKMGAKASKMAAMMAGG